MAKIEVRTQEEIEREEEERRQRLMRALRAQHDEAGSILAGPEDGKEPRPGSPPAPLPQPPSGATATPFVRNERKVGRNEPCPCGSGKKYKHCHGQLSSYG
jgi:preprotein translocase subunit SecA